jgi:hypothetical protein
LVALTNSFRYGRIKRKEELNLNYKIIKNINVCSKYKKENKNMKKTLSLLLLLVISLKAMETGKQNKLFSQRVAVLSLIEKKNPYTQGWERLEKPKTPIQFCGGVSFLQFDPNGESKRNMTTNTDIKTTLSAFNLSKIYMQTSLQKKLNNFEMPNELLNCENYSINSPNFHSGHSIGLAFLVMHLMNHFLKKSSNKTDTIVAATGSLNEKTASSFQDIDAIGGFLEKHEALKKFREAHAKKGDIKDIYFFYPRENKKEILVFDKNIQYFSVNCMYDVYDYCSEICEKINNEKEEMADELIPYTMPFIKGEFYENYLAELLENIQKKQNPLVPVLVNAYQKYRYSILPDQQKKHAKNLSNLIANNNLSLYDKNNIAQALINQYDLRYEDVINDLIKFSHAIKDFNLFQLLLRLKSMTRERKEIKKIESFVESIPQLTQDILSEDERKNFLTLLENKMTIDTLIETFLQKKTLEIDEFLNELEKLVSKTTRSKQDEQYKYTRNYSKFIYARLKKENTEDLLNFLNWQLKKKNLNNKYDRQITETSHIFQDFIEKDITINWILENDTLLDSNIIRFFSSEKVPLEKKFKFFENTKKTILKDYENYVDFCTKKALHELCSSEEGQKIYLNTISNSEARKIHTTILALVYAFFNYTDQREIKNNASTVLENFKRMNSTQKDFVLEYGDKKFVAFLESEQKKHEKLNQAQKDQK